LAEVREHLAEVREHLAEVREHLAEVREHLAEVRERLGRVREQLGLNAPLAEGALLAVAGETGGAQGPLVAGAAALRSDQECGRRVLRLLQLLAREQGLLPVTHLEGAPVHRG
jgi:hypothetical protein